MRKFRTLIGNRRGTATIEFALMSLFMFGTTMVALDFGFYTQQKMKLGSAVEQAAILAYNKKIGTSAATSDTSLISNYVRDYSGLKTTPTAAIKCNGTTACGDGRCSCINATTGAISVVGTCNAVCTGSASYSGNYLQITATATYNSVIVPDTYLGGKTMTQTAVVRLQ